MEISDSQLIEKYLNGDTASFDILALRYLKIVFNTALYYVKDSHDAEDITQDVFVKVLHHIASFDQTKAFKPWVLQITRNQALDWLKKKKPLAASQLENEEQPNFLDLAPDERPSSQEVLIQEETRQVIQSSLQKLPAHERRILFMRYVQGLTFREIGEELKEALDTIKSRHRRSLAKLKKILKESAFSA